MGEAVFHLHLTGGSMRPLLRSGQVAAVRKGREGLRPGDVVLYRVEGEARIHRLGFLGRRYGWIFDDTADVGWHRVQTDCIEGRVLHPSPLSRGLAGLVYALGAYVFFKSARAVKGVTKVLLRAVAGPLNLSSGI